MALPLTEKMPEWKLHFVPPTCRRETERPATLTRLMRRTPRLTAALIALAPIGLIIALIAVVLTGGLGQDSNSDGSTVDNALVGRVNVPLPLQQQVASQFETLPAKVRCQFAGTWVDPVGKTRTIARCWVVGGASFESGCYDVLGEEVTFAVREDRNAKFCSRPVSQDGSP